MTDWFAAPCFTSRASRPRSASMSTDSASQSRGSSRKTVGCGSLNSIAGARALFSNQWPEKVGKGLMFISLNVEPETYDAAVAALDALHADSKPAALRSRMVAGATGYWWSRISTATSFFSTTRTSLGSRRGELGIDAIESLLLHCGRWQWAIDDSTRRRRRCGWRRKS